jgi:hypothetical protein
MGYDLNHKIAKNFTLAEALYLPTWQLHAFPANESIYRNILLTAEKMQLIRDYFNKPISIHCWYRPHSYNQLIKGAKNSAHTTGEACDFHIDGISVDEVMKELTQKLDEWNIRMEANWGKSWCHVDLRPPGSQGRLFSP